MPVSISFSKCLKKKVFVWIKPNRNGQNTSKVHWPYTIMSRARDANQSSSLLLVQIRVARRTKQLGEQLAHTRCSDFDKPCRYHHGPNFRAAKQPIFGLLYVFHFIALLTVKHRERHANLPAVIASKWVTQQYKSMVNAYAPLWIFLLTCEMHLCLSKFCCCS